jgi:hypothetical protein
MTLVIRPEAIEELLASARWYNQQRSGLGNELIDEAWAVLGRIEATPEAFGRYEFYRGPDVVRRAGFARFPYSALFLVEPDCIGVLAFAPDKRRPLYWLNRLRDAET